LYDAVLIKDNHLAAMGAANLLAGLQEALARNAAREPKPTFVEVEVDTLEQLEQVLQVRGVDMVLLDNMPPEDMAQAVLLRNQAGLKGRVELEASGNVSLATVRTIAESGVERISVGGLTHSVRALDIGLDILNE
jgi:nicotinate-nucleotide pyrophosphorylase (carboxylating)